MVRLDRVVAFTLRVVRRAEQGLLHAPFVPCSELVPFIILLLVQRDMGLELERRAFAVDGRHDAHLLLRAVCDRLRVQPLELLEHDLASTERFLHPPVLQLLTRKLAEVVECRAGNVLPDPSAGNEFHGPCLFCHWHRIFLRILLQLDVCVPLELLLERLQPPFHESCRYGCDARGQHQSQNAARGLHELATADCQAASTAASASAAASCGGPRPRCHVWQLDPALIGVIPPPTTQTPPKEPKQRHQRHLIPIVKK